MKAVLFYGVRLPIQAYLGTEPLTEDYPYVFSENFIGSDWQLHVRQTKGRMSSYLCLARLSVEVKASEPFKLINPKGLQEQKMKAEEREELKDIVKSLGVEYAPPKWFLTASE
jgi:hypothetical protein